METTPFHNHLNATWPDLTPEVAQARFSIIKQAMLMMFEAPSACTMSDEEILSLHLEDPGFLAEQVIGIILKTYPGGTELPDWVQPFYKELEVYEAAKNEKKYGSEYY